MTFINNKIYPIEQMQPPAPKIPQYSRDIQIKRDSTQTKRPFMGMQYLRASSGCSACDR